MYDITVYCIDNIKFSKYIHGKSSKACSSECKSASATKLSVTNIYLKCKIQCLTHYQRNE